MSKITLQEKTAVSLMWKSKFEIGKIEHSFSDIEKWTGIEALSTIFKR